jgi:hypothetical protein
MSGYAFSAASGNGHGREDYSTVARFYQEAAGVDAAVYIW